MRGHFRAGKERSPCFRDLGESYDSTPVAKTSRGPRKWYPTVSLKHSVKGLGKVGQTKTVRVKVKVSSIEVREGEAPRTGLEIRGIEED